eukprot:scaffold146_cov146-Skeletonema_marinoi.AAC.3
MSEVINGDEYSQAVLDLFRPVEEQLMESDDMLRREHELNLRRAATFGRGGVLEVMMGEYLPMAREFERTVALGIAERMITNLLRRLAWVYVKDNCVSEMQAICDDLGHEVDSAVARVVNSAVARVREANADNPLFVAAEHWSVQQVEGILGPDPDL